MLANKKHGWIGLDLGATSVKAAQVVRKDGEFRLRAAAIIPRSPRWTAGLLADDQPISSADELRAAGSLCEELLGSSAAALFPVAMCDMIALDKPSEKRGAAADVLRAAEVQTDRPMRDRLYDSWPAGGQAGKINVVTAPRAWSDQISSDVTSGGWSCQIIDALPFALARASSMAAPESDEGFVAALDWGYGRATMCLVHRGAPSLVRTLRDCPYQSLLDVVSKDLRLEERDAELLLQRHGLDDGQGSDSSGARVVLDLLSGPLTRFADEIRRTIGYWQGLLRGKTPEAIYLFGGGGALRGVDGFLSRQLGMPIKSWDLPLEDSASADKLPPMCLLGAAAGMSAAAWEAS